MSFVRNFGYPLPWPSPCASRLAQALEKYSPHTWQWIEDLAWPHLAKNGTNMETNDKNM